MLLTMAEPHAIIRAWERHQLDLTVQDLKAMVRAIEANDHALKQATLNSGAEQWLLEVKGRWISIIYDRSARAIITVLPNFTRKKTPR